jgi:Bacterial protein of unknown function (DUF922)
MRERIRREDEARQAWTRREFPGVDEATAPTAAVFDAAAREQEPGRGGAAAVGRAIDGLHASAGNGAIARLIEGGATVHHREGAGHVRAARTTPTGQPVVQARTADQLPSGDDATTATGSSLPVQAAGAQSHGPSWTHIGPPTNSTYAVSGTLRDVANSIAARTEAGSVTTTPSRDTETWTPDGGDEAIIAARVTIAQVVELPSWSDKSSATANQQAEWDRFHTAITTHEAGHVATDKTSFAGAHSKMVGKTPSDGDKALDAVAAKATTDNDAYDTSTKHGLSQGTGINPNIDEVTKVP